MSVDPRIAPVWVEVNTDALEHNAHQVLKALSPGAQLLAVVKADAYGHGMVESARAFVHGGASYLGVAHLHSACELASEIPQVPVVAWLWEPVSGAALLPKALQLGVEIGVSSLAQLQVLQQVAESLQLISQIHLKVDTGMGRNGIMPAELPEFLQQLEASKWLELKGLMSHLYFADGTSELELSSVDEQAAVFQQCQELVEASCGKQVLAHLANTAALQRRADLHLDMVRAGIALYGYAPVADGKQLDLRPALSLKSRISLIKEVPAGQKVGYGALYECKSNERLALIPYGYADGIPRSLTHQFKVAVHCASKTGTGKICLAPQVGRISMDQIVVRLPQGCEAQAGDEVTVWGALEGISDAADLAEACGTISYELLTAVSTRLPRIYVQDAG